MVTSPESPLTPHVRLVLERVLRTECLTLECLRLQTQGGYNGQPGGGDNERFRAAEQRAYQRAEALLTQLLAATATTAACPALPDSSHDIR